MAATVSRRSRWMLVAGLVALAIGTAPRTAHAQLATGAINGLVSDETGGALPGVMVTAKNLGTGESRTVTTNESGRYQITALQPSRYSVTAELQGFATFLRTEVTVNVGSAVDVNVQMKVAALNETVTVSGEAPLVESTKTDLSSVITQEEIESLPSKQRQYLDFALLLPATVENVSTVQGTGAVIGGARSKEGTLLVDGFYNLDEGFTMPKQRHSQDTIQEFQLVTFGGAPEYGRAIGGVINAVTKSGTNELRGTGYGFFRDTKLNAQTFEEKRRGAPKSAYDRQQWGGSVGGPISRNRSFFFASYERVNENWPFDNGIRAADAAAIGLPKEDAGTVPRFLKTNFAFGKWDYNINSNQRLQASFSFTRYTDHMMCCLTARAARSYPYQLFADDFAYLANWTNIRPGGRLHEVKLSYFPRRYGTRGLQEGGPPLVPNGQINNGLLSNASAPSVTIASVASFGSVSLNNRINTYPVQVLYTSSVFANTHTIKFGADYMYAYYDYNQYNPLHGVYTFSSLANFQRGAYTQYTQSFGAISNPRTHQYMSLFVQDSWQLNKRLTMNYGLRYDLEFNPKQDPSGIPFGNDYNNLGPRLAVSYDLTSHGTTFLKLNTGVYYDRLWNNYSNNFYSLKDNMTRTSYTWTPTTAGAPVYPAVFATPPPNLPPSARDVIIMPSDVRVPTSVQFVGTLERALTHNVAISGSFVRSESWYKDRTLDRNLVYNETTRTFVRPDATYRRITQLTFDGPADYVGGIVDVNMRAARFGFNGNLTVSRARQVATGSPTDPRLGVENDFGLVPDNPKVRGVLSGWYNVTSMIQVSSNFTARSGMAVNPVASGLDLNGDGVTGDRTPTFGPFSFRAPGNSSMDLRLTWMVPFGDQKTRKIQFYLESFNIFNRGKVRTVDSNYGSSPGTPLGNFLSPTSYFPPREVQLGARIAF